jgi:hypothetical protein
VRHVDLARRVQLERRRGDIRFSTRCLTRSLRSGLVQSGSVATMRIAGVRLAAPVARLLSEILESEGYSETAGKIADAIERQITIEAPLTLEDYEAISAVLAHNCPAPLYRLRTELLEELRRLRRITGG